MGSQDVYFDLPSFARKHLKGCIEKFHLVEGKAAGGVMTLSNSNCIIYLSNLEDAVGFDFASIISPERKFDLRRYLNAIVLGGVAKHYPAPPRDWGSEEKFRYSLDSFENLVEASALDAPLSGDFSWVQKYDDFVAEYERLDKSLLKLSREEHPDAQKIRLKKRVSDLTWMEDMRRILAEQETNESQ